MLFTKLRLEQVGALLWLLAMTVAPGGPLLAQDSPSKASGADLTAGLQLRSVMVVPVQSEPQPQGLDHSKGQVWHRCTMSLAGSMCPACLIELEKHLKELPGIAYVNVQRPPMAGQSSAEPLSSSKDGNETATVENPTTKPRSAQLTLIYDGAAVQFDALLSFIKREKYKPGNISDADLAAKSAPGK